ncbi:hypothetical protein PsAD13_01063 [Pseudovibrio sp. Ad13]|jgi:hypothetical protein|nr:hypothetical protein PsAD13_01063 [Pseudovibrio sp. Ad13]KZK94578.1 hypothetical protein PsAD46_01000 [Pseudovibrio sp. Ad46]KZL01096.1 hypothetical protein PsW74_01890 [Pseudovibrio sp. W74]KZL01639.1 hypothetical protein PsAD5_00562 [Pseudovibrio sp. Ad5]KZL11161.1 hypothetical protein PsAD14_00911 [Pseudovibrio sp. Ad14]
MRWYQLYLNILKRDKLPWHIEDVSMANNLHLV